MPSVSSIVALASFASLALTTPVERFKKRGAGTLHIDQIPTTSIKQFGALALQNAYQKYNKPVPSSVATAAQSGNVVANPEQYDIEYLCPVTVGGTVMNLDFDTGSADL
jgi:aspergillopepsin I